MSNNNKINSNKNFANPPKKKIKLNKVFSDLNDESNFNDLKNRLFQIIHFMDNLPVVAIVLDANKKIVWYNEATPTKLGFSSVLNFNAKHIYDVLNVPDDSFFYEKIWETVLDLGVWQGQITFFNEKQEEVHQWARLFKLQSNDSKKLEVGVILSPFSDLKILNDQINSLSYYDQMTGVGNVRKFQDEIKRIIDESEINDAHVIYIQMKGLHAINLTYGYDVGDKALLECVSRLKEFTTDNCKLYRIVGDTFAFISLFKKDDLSFSNRFIRITNVLNTPYYIMGHEIALNVHFGVATYPSDADNSIKLIQCAEIALNYAVENKQWLYFYSPSLDEKQKKVLITVERLKRALKKDLLEMYYQPVVSGRDSKILVAEALLRWNDSVLGQVSPVDIIYIAEANGLMKKLGLWIIENVFKNKLHEQIHISINVTFSQLEDTLFVHQLANLQKKYEVKKGTVSFEIVEHKALENSVLANQTLDELVKMGFDISLDDFGTGHSSLSLVRQLPLRSLKIDGSFIKNITESPQQIAIVKSTIELSKNLNYFVVCEGVETKEEADFVIELGTDFLQGYYYHKPMPLAEIKKELNK